MGIPVLIIGKSGAGKSASLRNYQDGEVGIVNVLGKPLPFRSNLEPYTTDDYKRIVEVLARSKVNTVVIDDASYLMTNMFMRGHSEQGKGNEIFNFFNTVGDSFWRLIEFVKELPPEMIVYFIMHEEKSEAGDIKPKTIGKMLDEKVCIEGMFTIVLRALKENNNHVFLTKSRGFDVSKTPMGMFESEHIDNDLKFVDGVIREYYNLGGTEDAKQTA